MSDRWKNQLYFGDNLQKMKNKTLIIIVSLLAVLICLIMIVLLFYSVTPRFLIVLSLTIGVITGVFITILIQTLVKNIKNKRSENEKTSL